MDRRIDPAGTWSRGYALATSIGAGNVPGSSRAAYQSAIEASRSLPGAVETQPAGGRVAERHGGRDDTVAGVAYVSLEGSWPGNASWTRRRPGCVAPRLPSAGKPRPWRRWRSSYRVRGSLSGARPGCQRVAAFRAAGRLSGAAAGVATRSSGRRWHGSCTALVRAGTPRWLRISSRQQARTRNAGWSPHRRRDGGGSPPTTSAPRPPRSPRVWTDSARVVLAGLGDPAL